MADPVLRCVGLGKCFHDGSRTIEVLRGVDLLLQPGERLAVVGASGSGKSTLLNLLGGLEPPTAGHVEVAGRALDSLSEPDRCRWRNRHLGFVYQFHHLLAEFDAAENVAMPLLIGGCARREAFARARELLARVGLGERCDHRPAALSGGEQQRVAIARALVARPGCVLMDEPTGNLDPEASERVLALIEDLGREQAAFVVVTHDSAIAARMHRTLVLRDGRLADSHALG